MKTKSKESFLNRIYYRTSDFETATSHIFYKVTKETEHFVTLSQVGKKNTIAINTWCYVVEPTDVIGKESYVVRKTDKDYLRIKKKHRFVKPYNKVLVDDVDRMMWNKSDHIKWEAWKTAQLRDEKLNTLVS